MTSDSIELAAHPAVVATARLRTRRALRAWGLSELADDAEQIVSEAVANAVEAHHRERIEAPVRLTLLGGLRTLLIVVRDASSEKPLPRDPSVNEECGRGLLIVGALSDLWDVKAAPGGGKVVRCLIRGKRV